MVLPVTGVEMIVKLAIARIIRGLPELEVGRIEVDQGLEAPLDSLQQGIQLLAEPVLIAGLAAAEIREYISIPAIFLFLIGQARLPGHNVQFFQDGAAFLG